jgi:hypothetical protein
MQQVLHYTVDVIPVLRVIHETSDVVYACHNWHNLAPAFHPYGRVLPACYVELQNLDNRKRLSHLLVDSQQIFAREVD